jgi:hypothetical protein
MVRKTKKGGFFNPFSQTKKSKTQTKRGKPQKKGKRVKVGTEIKELGQYNNEQDCLMELRKPKYKGAKCRLIGYASYAIEKEVPVYSNNK